MKKLTIILSVCLWAVATQAQNFGSEAMRKLQMAEFAISNFYVDKVDEDKLVEEAIIKMLAQLDPHSTYSDAEEVKKMNEPLQGNFEGIGVQFQMIEDTLLVVQPVSNGPSEKVGILAGDRIVAVNDSAIAGVKMSTEDIIPLAERFITRFCKQYEKPALRLDNSAREKLTLHPWFGNIRELEHAIEKAVIICDGTFLSAGSFQLQRRNEAPETPVSTLEDMEKQMIRQTLEKCGSNLSAVASQLGITRQTLYNKMKKYGL